MKKDFSLDDVEKVVGKVLRDELKHTNAKVDGLAEIMTDNFDLVFDRLDKIEFNTLGQEHRIMSLEDKVRIISTKIGLSYKN